MIRVTHSLPFESNHMKQWIEHLLQSLLLSWEDDNGVAIDPFSLTPTFNGLF